MLDIARVIRRSNNDRFDTVFFFDKTNEDVIETQRRIPGSIGFPDDFVDLVLREDPEEDAPLDSNAPLNPPEEGEDTHEVRTAQLQTSLRRDFKRAFPFDVLNLDLEQFFLVPGDEFPGRMFRALRKLFEWQRRALPGAQRKTVDGFSLMFTTQIGPPNLTEEYLNMLRDRLTENLARDADLLPLFQTRTGLADVRLLQETQFEMFFKLGVPKVLASILKEEDWYVDATQGIRTYEFERPRQGGSYKMLHFVMDVVRQKPPYDRRDLRAPTADAEAAYQEVVRQFITEPEIVVTLETIDQDSLQRSLELIKARRRKYCPECPEG
ncbi:MAG: hypothetical protein H7Z16_11080 [Pyrinomonadaceae bacterium]|nr:hypothetical protein [Pyrinomonadaceae bacterium]